MLAMARTTQKGRNDMTNNDLQSSRFIALRSGAFG
jgi:hypothetical protein